MHRRSWTEFKGVAKRREDSIRAAINPIGEFIFDLAAFQKMGEPQAIKLLYERSTRTVGLSPVHPDEPNAILVRHRYGRSQRVVRSVPFLRANGIEVPMTLRFMYPAIEGNILTLDLRTAIPSGKGRWNRGVAKPK